MINKWQKDLAAYGYSYNKKQKSDKAYVKYNGNIKQQIWEDRIPNRGLVINTFILIRDPFYVEPTFEYVVVICGRLTINGIVVEKCGGFWNDSDDTVAFASLEKHALPWFEENCLLEKLIEYVTNDVVISPVLHKKKPSGISFIKELFGSKIAEKQDEVEIKIRPINRLKLSLLHYHNGNIELACEHALEWLKYVRNMPGEPERTHRQLKEMGCATKGSNERL